jgi:hypothetical protein
MKNKIGRNDPCPCGSGKKFKKCCAQKGFEPGRQSDNAPPVKISEAILKIAEPLIRKYPKHERITVIIDLAVAAWNISSVPEEGRGSMEEKIVEIMPAEMDAMGVATIYEQIDLLIQRKIELYDDVKFLVKSHKLSFGENGRLTLDVDSIPLDA